LEGHGSSTKECPLRLEKVLPVPEQNYSKNSANKSPYINPIFKKIKK
jgi:hypothetical protein